MFHYVVNSSLSRLFLTRENSWRGSRVSRRERMGPGSPKRSRSNWRTPWWATRDVFTAYFKCCAFLSQVQDQSASLRCNPRFKFQSRIDWAIHQIPKELIITFSWNHSFHLSDVLLAVVTNVQVCVLIRPITGKQTLQNGPTAVMLTMLIYFYY